jgi:LacI family transcriptional regulator
MRGEKMSPTETRIAPLGVSSRQSTDVLAVDDHHVAGALRFIREHACDPVNVGDVLRAVPLSRSILEKRFRRVLGRTVHDEIISMRLNRARELLAETDLSLAEIAARTGFDHPEYFSVVFKRETSESPGRLRRRMRLGHRTGVSMA